MKLSVTKALRLRSALEERLKAFDVKAVVELDVDSRRVQEDAKSVIDEAAEGVSARLETFGRLSALLASIRTAIARQNVESGVEAILAQQGDIDRQIAKLKSLVAVARVDVDSVNNKIARKTASLKAPQQSASYYGQAKETETISFNTISNEFATELEGRILELRRKKVELEDNRSVANAHASIEIGDDDYALLNQQGVI